MSAGSHRFEAIRGLEGLSPAGRKAVLDARVRLDVWIDENLDRIETGMKAALEARRRTLSSEAAALQAELAAARSSLSDVLAGLASLEAQFDSGDGMTVDEAVRATRERILAVRTSLEAHEERVRALVPAPAFESASHANGDT